MGRTSAHPSDWIYWLDRLIQPILTSAAAGTLHRDIPLETKPGQAADRAKYTHLEAIGRTLAGLAPFLELATPSAEESDRQSELRNQARAAIRHATDPRSTDHCNFTEGMQPVVDAAFLAHALLRAPTQLAQGWSAPERQDLIDALLATRRIRPYFNNWLLFAAMAEAALDLLGVPADPMRVDYALRQHEQWYLGDGHYADGPRFHADYYNSFVIHPMLLAVLDHFKDPAWDHLRAPALTRAQRYAVIQERSINADGSFAPIGRSLAYRCGAFQLLAQLALEDRLPPGLPPAQVRGALGAVIRRTLDAPGTYDANGWLTIGLCGHQPGLGETYISTGSLYLASTAFLPLGLPATHPFWSGPDLPWTAQRIWELGEDVPADMALKD